VFGPFICRNHFAYYANLCLGLTAGLLLGTRYFLTAARTDRTDRTGRGGGATRRELLRDPRVLWLAACLAILFAGLVACLSRGGLFGLIAGGTVAGVLMLTRGAAPRLTFAAGTLGLAVVLVGWLGFDRVSRRWEHVFNDTAEHRTLVWQRTLQLVARFPILGTGLGTFGVAELQTRRPGDEVNVIWDHAHNDFLELWVEAGTVPLLIALFLIALVMRQGVRAYLRHSQNGMGRLALGGLVGFIAVTVQSFVDFGLHVPAVAVLAAVVAAMLANLAEAPEPERAAAATGLEAFTAGAMPWWQTKATSIGLPGLSRTRFRPTSCLTRCCRVKPP
jgi:O-antigen ligase